MNDKAAQRPLAHLTRAELNILDKVATRYSKTVGEHASLLGLMNLAIRRGDRELFTRTQEQLEQSARHCDACYSALRIVREELSAEDPGETL